LGRIKVTSLINPSSRPVTAESRCNA
jgi:hypothetical protein